MYALWRLPHINNHTNVDYFLMQYNDDNGLYPSVIAAIQQ